MSVFKACIKSTFCFLVIFTLDHTGHSVLLSVGHPSVQNFVRPLGAVVRLIRQAGCVQVPPVPFR